MNYKKNNNFKLKLRKLNSTFFISRRYKGAIVAFVFFVVFIHFIAMAIFPHSVMAARSILIIALGVTIYIWVQELKDKRRLEFLNKNLVKTQNKLEVAQVDTIASLILTAEAKDTYTHGHSKRVAKYSMAVARKMNLSKEEQEIIERAAILHDLGKIGIDDSILKKSDKLTDKEWVIMKGHPGKSVEILQPLKFLKKEKKIILHHHERIDGCGYPDGLKGTSIPLGSQIIAVVDTFDAMNTARSYRKALTKETIIEELKNSSGTQLSPEVVDVFLQYLEQRTKN